MAKVFDVVMTASAALFAAAALGILVSCVQHWLAS